MDCPATQLAMTPMTRMDLQNKKSRAFVNVVYAVCGRTTKGAHLLESMLRIDFTRETIRVDASTASLIVSLHVLALK